MKKEINRTLGNSLRCILPSFWWKRLLGKMVDKIESAESSASIAMKMATLAGMEASNKQDRLVSGSNIKTINGESILGGGNITIEAGDGVEQIIFYATENDAYPLTAEEIAHNVESMQKQRTAFRNNTPVSFLVSVKGSGFQICEPASFYFPSNNTDIPVGFCIVGGGSAQFMVTCNWDGTANVKDLNWIDTELSDTSKNPVQNKAVKAYVDEKVANVGGSEIREFYTGDSLTDEQKAWNLETAQAILDKKAIVICNGSILGDSITTNNDGSKEFINSAPTPQGVLYAGVKVEEDGTASVFFRQLYLDDKLSDKSISAVQNKVITAALNNKADKTYVDNAVANITVDTSGLATKEELNAYATSESLQSLGLRIQSDMDTDKRELTEAINTKQGKIDDLEAIRSGAALGVTALQSIPDEYITESELFAKKYATTSQLAAKQNTISDLSIIRSNASLGATAIQKVKTINGESLVGDGDVEVFTKALYDNLIEETIANEEIYAAAVNDLNIRVVNTDSVLSTEISNRESLQTEFQTFKTQVTENEEVWAIALTDINDRIGTNYQHGEDTYATKNSLSTEIQTINTVITDNEEVIAATLTDLNNQIASLNALITDLTNRIETLENA